MLNCEKDCSFNGSSEMRKEDFCLTCNAYEPPVENDDERLSDLFLTFYHGIAQGLALVPKFEESEGEFTPEIENVIAKNFMTFFKEMGELKEKSRISSDDEAMWDNISDEWVKRLWGGNEWKT